jgi:hypothetical protein
MRKSHLTISLIILGLFSSLPSCTAVEDVQSTAALHNVDFTFDSLQIQQIVPAGALDGKSFSELMELDPETYSNPAKYGLDISSHYTCSNQRSNARDASFSGMIQDIQFSVYDQNPLRLLTPAFEIKKNEIKPIDTQGSINLLTHRLPGLYIFRQTIDGLPISTAMLTELLYKIGNQEGSISLPRLEQDIPTRASDEMKAFLTDLLNSGIFDE